VELTTLGADGTYPTQHGACSGYLVRHDGFTMWMDAGNGTLSKLQRHATFGDVDAIFLSHAHPDHCADLYPFFYALLMERRTVPVFTARGVRDKLITLIGEDSRARFTSLLDWHEMSPGDVGEAGPLRIEAFDAAHSTANVTARISAAGKTLCYSGDTGPNEHLGKAAAGADVFLCEASWLESDIGMMDPIHMTARQTGEVARAADVGRLVLTHVWPRNDRTAVLEQAAAGYGAEPELAREIESTQI